MLLKRVLKQVAAAAITYLAILAELHHQKRFNFYKIEFSKISIVKWSFMAERFLKLPWLHYCKDDDTVFCHTWLKAFKIIEDECY